MSAAAESADYSSSAAQLQAACPAPLARSEGDRSMALLRVNRQAAAICCRNSGNRPSVIIPFCELVL
jgi:hypothetical protein